ARHRAQGHRGRTRAGAGGVIPVILKRCIVPTGEPDNPERVPSGSVGGWGKRSVSYLARSLPNLVPRSRFQQQVSAGVRRPLSQSCVEGGLSSTDSLPYDGLRTDIGLGLMNGYWIRSHRVENVLGLRS